MNVLGFGLLNEQCIHVALGSPTNQADVHKRDIGRLKEKPSVNCVTLTFYLLPAGRIHSAVKREIAFYLISESGSTS